MVGLASAEVANPQNLYLKPLDKFSGEFSFSISYRAFIGLLGSF